MGRLALWLLLFGSIWFFVIAPALGDGLLMLGLGAWIWWSGRRRRARQQQQGTVL